LPHLVKNPSLVARRFSALNRYLPGKPDTVQKRVKA